MDLTTLALAAASTTISIAATAVALVTVAVVIAVAVVAVAVQAGACNPGVDVHELDTTCSARCSRGVMEPNETGQFAIAAGRGRLLDFLCLLA